MEAKYRNKKRYTVLKHRGVVSTCVRKKPGLSHPTSVAGTLRETGEGMGRELYAMQKLAYLPVECANPCFIISMGKTIGKL